MNIQLSVSRAEVLEEVALKTGYVGAKMPVKEDEQDPFERIPTIDEDHPELKRYFDECRFALVSELGRNVSSEGFQSNTGTPHGDAYAITLNVGDGFNQSVTEVIEIGLFNYFVYGIIGRWFMVVNKEEAAAYMSLQDSFLRELKRKVVARTFTRPMGPFGNGN